MIRFAQFLVVALSATLIHQATAEFGVTLKTTASDGVDTSATRLYEEGSFTTPAATSTPVWLVIDRDGDGIWAGPNAMIQPVNPAYDGTQAGLAAALVDADDRIVFTSTPAAAPPSQLGRINDTSIRLDAADQTGGTGLNQQGGTIKPAHVLVFDHPNFADGARDGVNGPLAASGLIPNLGNVVLRIVENVASDVHSATAGVVVPPPTISGVSAQVSGGNMVVTFSISTSLGTTSQIQSTTSLSSPIVWVNEGATIPGDGSTKPVSVSTPLSETAEKYFRVRIL
jgi:hypothetical protein